MALLGTRPEETIGVGDSLEHDVRGATRAGLSSVFVTNGIHASELPAGDAEALAALCSKHEAVPTHAIPWFAW